MFVAAVLTLMALDRDQQLTQQVPPSLMSVALRGGWSMGKVFDVYFNFVQCGDNYLGRILAGLDPNETNFGNLPPYWNRILTIKLSKCYDLHVW